MSSVLYMYIYIYVSIERLAKILIPIKEGILIIIPMSVTNTSR